MRNNSRHRHNTRDRRESGSAGGRGQSRTARARRGGGSAGGTQPVWVVNKDIKCFGDFENNVVRLILGCGQANRLAAVKVGGVEQANERRVRCGPLRELGRAASEN